MKLSQHRIETLASDQPTTVWELKYIARQYLELQAELAAARAALEHQRMALTVVRDRQHGNVSEADLNQGIALIDAALAGEKK